MNKNLLFGIFALFLIIMSTQSVYAIDILDSVLQPFRGTDVGRIYENYSLFIDAVLYLLLFLGLTQLIYVKAYGKKEGKLVAIAIGLMLTFAMALMESRTGFRLGSLMPIGAIILIFVLFILLFNLFQGVFNDSVASFSLAFLIMYGFLMSTFKPLYDWLEQNAPLLAALVQIAMVISFFPYATLPTSLWMVCHPCCVSKVSFCRISPIPGLCSGVGGGKMMFGGVGVRVGGNQTTVRLGEGETVGVTGVKSDAGCAFMLPQAVSSMAR